MTIRCWVVVAYRPSLGVEAGVADLECALGFSRHDGFQAALSSRVISIEAKY